MVANSLSGDTESPPPYERVTSPQPASNDSQRGYAWANDQHLLEREKNSKNTGGHKNSKNTSGHNTGWMTGQSAGVGDSGKASHTAVFVAPDATMQDEKKRKKWVSWTKATISLVHTEIPGNIVTFIYKATIFNFETVKSFNNVFVCDIFENERLHLLLINSGFRSLNLVFH